MLDGVQVRLLLQACGLLIIPVAVSWCISGAARVWHRATQLKQMVEIGDAPISVQRDVYENLAFEATWLVLCVLMLVAGWRLLFAKGYLFPMLVRSLAQ